MSRISTRRRVAIAAVPVVLAVGAASAIAATADGVPIRLEPIDVNRNGNGNQPGSGPVFLKLDGIPGESADALHPGEIDVQSFGIGAKNSSTGGRAR